VVFKDMSTKAEWKTQYIPPVDRNSCGDEISERGIWKTHQFVSLKTLKKDGIDSRMENNSNQEKIEGKKEETAGNANKTKEFQSTGRIQKIMSFIPKFLNIETREKTTPIHNYSEDLRIGNMKTQQLEIRREELSLQNSGSENASTTKSCRPTGTIQKTISYLKLSDFSREKK